MNIREVFVFRHTQEEDLVRGITSWNYPAQLTLDGVHQANKIAFSCQFFPNSCSQYYTSPVFRAQETLWTILDEWGIKPERFERIAEIHPGLFTPFPLEWLSDDLDEQFWKDETEFIKREGERFLLVIKSIARRIPREMDKAFCLSHGGIIDAGYAAAREKLGIQNAFSGKDFIKRGHGVIFQFTGDNLSAVSEVKIS